MVAWVIGVPPGASAVAASDEDTLTRHAGFGGEAVAKQRPTQQRATASNTEMELLSGGLERRSPLLRRYALLLAVRFLPPHVFAGLVGFLGSSERSLLRPVNLHSLKYLLILLLEVVALRCVHQTQKRAPCAVAKTPAR